MSCMYLFNTDNHFNLGYEKDPMENIMTEQE